VAYPPAISASVTRAPAWTKPSCCSSVGRLTADISTSRLSSLDIRDWKSFMIFYFQKLALRWFEKSARDGVVMWSGSGMRE